MVSFITTLKFRIVTISIHVHVCALSCFSCARLFLTLWTVAHQAPLSMGFSRQEYWSGLPCLVPGESSQPRDQTHISCTAGGFFTAEPPGKHRIYKPHFLKLCDSKKDFSAQAGCFAPAALMYLLNKNEHLV